MHKCPCVTNALKALFQLTWIFIGLVVLEDARAALVQKETVLPYRANVDVLIQSALFETDGSARLSGSADAALDLTLDAQGQITRTSHRRVPFIENYGFPYHTELKRNPNGSLMQFDYLGEQDILGIFNNGCRVRVEAPSLIDFNSAYCGQLDIRGENAYLWFRGSGTGARLIRRENNVELWNMSLRTIPDQGMFDVKGAVFHDHFAYVYGLLGSTRQASVIKINPDAQIVWIKGLGSSNSMVHMEFDSSLKKFAIWLDDTESTSRLYLLSLDGLFVERALYPVPRAIYYIRGAAVVYSDSLSGFRSIDGMTGRITWTLNGLIAGNFFWTSCLDQNNFYVAQGGDDNSRIVKVRASNGEILYQLPVPGKRLIPKLLCDQNEAMLITKPVDETRFADQLTRIDSNGAIVWQREFPSLPREPKSFLMDSNGDGEMLIRLGLQNSETWLPIWYRLDAPASSRFVIEGEPTEHAPESSMRLNEDGSMLRVIARALDETYAMTFEKRAQNGEMRWFATSPKFGAFHAGQIAGGSTWLVSAQGERPEGLHAYEISRVGQLRSYRIPGAYLNVFGSFGENLVGVVGVQEGPPAVLQITEDGFELSDLPGQWGNRFAVNASADVFGVVDSPKAIQKFDGARRHIVWSVALAADAAEPIADDVGGVWVNSYSGGVLHIDRDGRTITPPNALDSGASIARGRCKISSIIAAKGGSAIGLGYVDSLQRCIVWLDPRGYALDDLVLEGRAHALARPRGAQLNILVSRANSDGLEEAVVLTVERENFLDGFE